MKKHWLILFGGLALAVLAYTGAYRAGSSRCCAMMDSKTPELSWLQSEFHVSDAEFARVEALHKSYVAACAERCQRIDDKNAELQRQLSSTNVVTPEIEKALADAAQLRVECQKAMLQHFYEISRTMPPDQGKRYLEWITSCTISPAHESMTRIPSGADHEHDGH
jgi:Heavy-metal resistance